MTSESKSQLTNRDIALLEELETALWQETTRYDRDFLDRVLAADFHEYGRSGRAYDRETILNSPPQPIHCRLPLRDFQCRLLSPEIVQVTYISERRVDGEWEKARRSSIWSRRGDGWELRFHQGTPLYES